jgi:hypothetical protein
VAERDRPLENVFVSSALGNRRKWPWNFQNVAEFGKKQDVIRALGRPGILPTFDKGLY